MMQNGQGYTSLCCIIVQTSCNTMIKYPDLWERGWEVFIHDNHSHSTQVLLVMNVYLVLKVTRVAYAVQKFITHWKLDKVELGLDLRNDVKLQWWRLHNIWRYFSILNFNFNHWEFLSQKVIPIRTICDNVFFIVQNWQLWLVSCLPCRQHVF